MGRNKAFNRNEVLDRAVQLFWSQGYDATSMSELHKAMGIGRQSLYDTFGDKQRLFSEVLDRYLSWNRAFLSNALPKNAGMAELRQYMYGSVQSNTAQTPRKGCLLMRSCSQVAPHDDRVQARTQRGLQEMTEAYRCVLAAAQARGEVRDDVDPLAAARSLTSQMAGMGILAQSGASEAELRSVVDVALAGLLNS